MQINGLLKTTLLDYPGLVAATIFLGHCNFRCPFCHNMNLVLHPEQEPTISKEEVFSFLQSRKGILDGVCITGGEPTLSQNLASFIKPIKDMGYNIKLDTNGYFPEVLASLYSQKLLDYVAMDIKSSYTNYADVIGLPTFDSKRIQSSISIIMSSGVPYEFRTTVVKEYHNETTFTDIASMISGASHYYLQSFKDSDFVLNHSLHSYSREMLQHFQSILAPHIENVDLRGID